MTLVERVPGRPLVGAGPTASRRNSGAGPLPFQNTFQVFSRGLHPYRQIHFAHGGQALALASFDRIETDRQAQTVA